MVWTQDAEQFLKAFAPSATRLDNTPTKHNRPGGREPSRVRQVVQFI